MPDLRNHPGDLRGGRTKYKNNGSRRILILHDHVPCENAEISQATLMANLASHFGSTDIAQVRHYRAGDILRYDALIYLVAGPRNPFPAAFRRDVNSGRRPVLWLKENVDDLGSRSGSFAATDGGGPTSRAARFQGALSGHHP